VTEPDVPELDADLRALFEEERASYTFDDARLGRLYRRVEAAVTFGAREAPTPTASPPAPAAPGIAPWKAALGAVVAFGLGVAAGGAARRPAPPDPAPPSSDASAVPVAPSESVSTPAPSLEPPLVPAPRTSADAHAGAPALPSATTSSPPASSLADEQALVDRARAALARGRAPDALAAVDEHQRRFPRGRLAEEREILAIQALVAAGRSADARLRAARFRTTFPKSLYLPSLGKIVGDP